MADCPFNGTISTLLFNTESNSEMTSIS